MSEPQPKSNWADPLTRRSFLRWTAVVGVGSALGWRFLFPAPGVEPGPLKALSRNQAKVLAAVYSTITLDADPQSVIRALGFMDGFVSRLDDRTRFEFKAALVLVEQTPLFFQGFIGRFTSLEPADRRRCLEDWRSGAEWGRPVFSALKDLSYLCFYTRPENWPAIQYQGPMVEAGSANPSLEARYEGLEAQS